MNHSNGTEVGLSPSGEACRSDSGASLPPRKRLLAGLKQNGWLSSPPAAPPFMQEVKLEVDLGGAKLSLGPAVCEPDRACLGESGEETIVQGECNADEDVNADKSESGSKRQKSSSPATNSRGLVKKLSQTVIGFNNQGESKLRRKSKGSKALLSSDLRSTTAHLRKESVSQREMAAAAKLTAVLAAKTAVEAKAIAADRAAAAAKAAAVAKAALEAVAIAACDEAPKRRKKLSRRHHKVGISGKKQRSREVELKQEIKFTRVSQMPPPVDDEELARQLHRAMNSSPRISRSLTASHRSKEYGTSLSSNQRRFQCTHELGRRRSSSLKDVEKPEIKAFRQISFDSSKSHCIEADVQLKSMTTMNEIIPVNNSSQWPGSFENNFSEDITSDSVASEGNAEDMVSLQKADGEHSNRKKEKKPRRKRINQDPGLLNCRKVNRITKSTSTSKNESVFSNNQMCSNVTFEDWAVKANGMDIEQSVNQSASHIREQKAVGIRNANKKRSGENFLQDNEMHDMLSERDSEEAEKESTISTETRLAVPLIAIENQVVKGAPNGVLEYGEHLETDKPDLPVDDLGVDEIEFRGESEASGLSLGSEIKKKKVAQKEVNESTAIQDVLKKTCPDRKSKSMLKSLSHGEGQTWHQEILKGLPTGCSAGDQTFGGGTSLTPFRSGPPVSLRTPAFASVSTTRHS